MTLTSASSPSCSPPCSLLLKEVSSPADRPSRAVVQTVQHGAGAELVAHAFLGVDGLAVDLGVEVDVREVALGSRTVDADQGAEALAQGFEAVVHVLIGDLGLGHVDLQAVKFRQLDVGTTLDGRGELQLGLVLGGFGHFLHVNLRLGHRMDLLLLKGALE